MTVKMARTLSDVDSLEELLRKLRRLQTKWNEHLLFIAAETSCDLSISVNDPKTPLHDALSNLCREATVVDLRIRRLVQTGSLDLNDEESESWCSVKHLFSLIDEPLGAETASATLRRAAEKLEFEVRDVPARLAYLENGASEKIEDLVTTADQVLSVELKEPTKGMADEVRRAERWRDALAREPEGAVWNKVETIALAFYEEVVDTAKMARRLESREGFWSVMLTQAAEVGVSLGQRQALITEFFDYEGDEDEDEDEDEDRDADEDQPEDEYANEATGDAMDLDDSDEDEGGQDQND